MKRLLTLFILPAFSVSLALAQTDGGGGGGPVKSQQPKISAQALKLTPQQKTELLRQSLPGHVRRSPQISNPTAASFYAAILASLRSQRQGADADLAALAAVDGSVRPTSADFPPLPGTGWRVKPTPPPPVKVSGSPQHPDAPQQARPCLHPGIATVNGKISGITFTPIAEYNLYTIKGCGFGQSGNVYLQGPFAGGKIPLNVQIQKTKNAVLGTWSDGLIIVSMDPNLSGEISHDGVTLVVEPAGGSPLQKPVAFFPAQETVFLDRIPGWIPKFALPFAKDGFHSPSQLTPGMTLDVVRAADEYTQSIHGTDVFDFSALTDGFWVIRGQLSYYWPNSWPRPGAPNQPIDVTNWNLGWADGGKSLLAYWFTGTIDGGQTEQLLESYYSLSVWVEGPRGVSPFRTMVPLPKPAIRVD